MDRIQQMMQRMQGGEAGGAVGDAPQVDTAEQIYISSLALLKMLKHGVQRRAGCGGRGGWQRLARRPAAKLGCVRPRHAQRPAAGRSDALAAGVPACAARTGVLLDALQWAAPACTLPPRCRALLCPRAGRAGVPMEVMGLMLGEFVDDYTVKVRPRGRGWGRGRLRTEQLQGP